jgi:DNA-binding transcriptional ArsR family regulator
MANRHIGPKIDIDRLFAALGDPTRRRLLGRLALQPKTVTQLAEELEITTAAVLQHVAWLEEVSLVTSEKLGRSRTCSIHPAGFDALERWIQNHRSIWEVRLNRLDKLLGKPKKKR